MSVDFPSAQIYIILAISIALVSIMCSLAKDNPDLLSGIKAKLLTGLLCLPLFHLVVSCVLQSFAALGCGDVFATIHLATHTLATVFVTGLVLWVAWIMQKTKEAKSGTLSVPKSS